MSVFALNIDYWAKFHFYKMLVHNDRSKHLETYMLSSLTRLDSTLNPLWQANEWQFALAIFFEETVRRYLQPDIMSLALDVGGIATGFCCCYPLVMSSSLRTWKRPSRNSGFNDVPMNNMVIFHSCFRMFNQRVNLHFPMVFLWLYRFIPRQSQFFVNVDQARNRSPTTFGGLRMCNAAISACRGHQSLGQAARIGS